MKDARTTVARQVTGLLPWEALTLLPLLGALTGLIRPRTADVEDEAGLSTAELLVLIVAVAALALAIIAILTTKLSDGANDVKLK